MSPYVLIVDDDEDARQIFGAIVSYLKFETRTAANGAEALEHIRQEAPVLMILDMMMPVMNGYQVLDALAADDGIPALPIVVVSAAQAETLVDLPGVSHVLRKAGFTIPQLRAILLELLPPAPSS